MQLLSSGITAAAACLLPALLLTGCALQNSAVPSPDLTPAAAINGTVHGGSQPIFGAKVYLLAVNPTGYAGPGILASASNASVSLLIAADTGHSADAIGSYALTNNTTGGFGLAGDYSCTSGFAQSTGNPVALSGSEQVYLYVLGGQAQNIASANTSSGLLVALGACNNPTLQVNINEMTTVATAYAFAGFATDATHIGSSSSTLALTGLSNAFANVGNLASVSTGSAMANSSGITRPTATINTIANILASCVDGLTANSNCGTLFQYTESGGATGTAPTDTATAAINLAHNPWPTAAGMTALYPLAPGIGAPYATALSSQPNDFTLALSLTGGGLNNSYNLAIDGSGNAWVVNRGNSHLVEFSSTGTVLSGSGYTGGGLNVPTAVAIDSVGNVWTANVSGNSLSEFSAAGSPISTSSGYTGGGLNQPVSVAFDASGDAWATNGNANDISEFSSAGAVMSGSSGYTGGGINGAASIAFDVSGNAWLPNQGGDLSKFSSTGQPISGNTGYTGGGLDSPNSVAIDGSGNLWIADVVGNRISEFSSSTATAISGSGGYTGGGLNLSEEIAIDGAGNVWIANQNNPGLSEFSSSGTAITGSNGYAGTITRYALSIGIDGSGDVWTTGTTNTVAEVIGAAAPVVTPIVANLRSPYGSHAVNRP